MSETGDRLRNLFTEIAPPIDVERIVQNTAVHVRSRRGWLVAVAAATMVAVVGVGSFFLFGGADRSAEVADGSPATVTTSLDTTTPSTSGETTTTVAEGGFVPRVMRPVRIECSSELADYPCDALVDGDETTRWNAVDGGVGAEITMMFDQPVQITAIDLFNPGDPEAFARNARIRGIEVLYDDLPQATTAELEDTGAQTIKVETIRTAVLTFRITGVFPGQAYEGKEPFGEVALAEIQVWGRVAPEANTPDGQQSLSTTDLSGVGRPALEAASLYLGRIGSQVRLIRWVVTDVNAQWESRQITFDDAMQNLSYVAAVGFSDAWVVPAQDLMDELPGELGQQLRDVGEALDLEGTVGVVLDGFRAPDDGTIRRNAIGRFEDAAGGLLARIEGLQLELQQAVDALGGAGERPTGDGSHFVVEADGWDIVDVWESADGSGGQLTQESLTGGALIIWTGTTAQDQAAVRDLAQAGDQATSDKFVDERIAGSLWALGSEAVAYAPEPTIHMVSWVDAERGLVVVQMRGGTFIDLTRLLNDLRLVDDAEWEAMVAQYPSTGPVTATTIPQETP